MALSMLAGGAECGPSNPLQGLTKRFDQDRGIQQAFRSTTNSAGPDQDAARFFSSNGPQAQLPSLNTPYDVSALRAALPLHPQAPVHAPEMQKQVPIANWASDFALQQPLFSAPSNVAMKGPEVSSRPEVAMPNHNMLQMRNGAPQAHMQWNPGMGSMSIASPPLSSLQQPSFNASQISWDQEFSSQESAINQAAQEQAQPVERTAPQVPLDGDDLARTAGLLLENVRDEQNPKFQKSQFLDLMRKLRDRDVIVEGNQMVENEGQRTYDVKGKGRAIDPTPLHSSQSFNMSQAGQAPTRFAEAARTQLEETSAKVEESEIDAYFRQENMEYQQYWNQGGIAGTSQASIPNADVTSWERLQHDWDQFEATATGIKHVDLYQFQDNNPYMLGDSSTTRQHMMHSGYFSLSESVLQLEAAVQRDMTNAMAWFELGVKQQENEREQKAFQALKRSLELDPTHLPTWLALGVSNTNESNRAGTYDAIREWVNRNPQYKDVVQQFQAQNPLDVDASLGLRYSHLIDNLIAMARSDTSGKVDADVQIALAILLNTNEEYEKAQDCFLSALAVRPEDWLLYNRVGATMANSGRAENALEYYYKALELNPGYIRARFNLGISCINLRRYEEAAQHILDALVLQDNDGIRDSAGLNEKRGVTTTALWDSLKTSCLHMQRIDLATLCDRRDLEGFRSNFHNTPASYP
ncbi:hypothetical protein H0H92_008330 [Tricholoma furcatifolium]|nr:hypothetical protein H0H92_008330 [Tricholoma furcatifolium]